LREALEEAEFSDRQEAEKTLERTIRWYNDKRLHSALGFLRPKDYYRGRPSDLHEARRKNQTNNPALGSRSQRPLNSRIAVPQRLKQLKTGVVSIERVIMLQLTRFLRYIPREFELVTRGSHSRRLGMFLPRDCSRGSP